MGLQLIFVVETDSKCKSDWIYIKDTLEWFYDFDRAHTKLSPVFMAGKNKYLKKEKEITTGWAGFFVEKRPAFSQLG